MAHLQYNMPGDPRLVDQLVYELKSKGIFDQFRKDCIADVDTRPAYQNLRQRVENSVSTFLARQCWQPDLNKNQLREKLRKHILDGNYLEQGVERIVDQVVNPKVATVFVPKVEDLVYNYLGITRKKTVAETSNEVVDLLPTDLEAVSPGSVKSNHDKNESMEVEESSQAAKMDVDEYTDKEKLKEENTVPSENNEKDKIEEAETSGISELTINDSDGSDDKESIPLPAEEIRPEDIPPPENSPPKVELEKIELPKEPDVANDIPLPDEISKVENESFFKPINTDDDDSSSDSSLRRNMSPLTPIRNYNNENSCDAQQGFENDFSGTKDEEIKEPSSFRFAIEAKSAENSLDDTKTDKKEAELSYQFNQVNINNFNTPAYEDSSNSNNLQIDYESDANSKINNESKVEPDQNSEDVKKSKKTEERKSSHKSSHRSRDSHKHSSSRDKKSDSKPSSSRDSSRHDKKSSKDESKHKSNDKERSRDRSDKKDSKDSSRHRSSHKSSHKDSKSHRSSSSSHRHSSKHSEEKKSSSSSHKEKEKSSEKSSSKEGSKEKSKDSKSSSNRSSDKEKKGSRSSSSKSKSSEKDKDKKTKKDTDDHYSLSGRGNPNRRSTDRDSNDGSSSSKGSHRPSSSKSSESKKDSKESTSKSDNTSGSGSTTPSDKENMVRDKGTKASVLQNKPIIRVETHLETPVSSPPRLPFVPDITLKKPKIAANFEEAKKIMKMRKFLEEEQRRMNQEAVLLLEFQANVRPSLSQVYSSIPGPELEFACDSNTSRSQYIIKSNENASEMSLENQEQPTYTNAELFNELNEGNQTDKILKDNSVKELESNENNVIGITEPDESNKNDKNISDPTENEVVAIETTSESVCDGKNTFKVRNIQEENHNDAVVKVSEEKLNEIYNIDKFEVTVVTEKLSDTENHGNETKEQNPDNIKESKKEDTSKTKPDLSYFAEHEKYEAELEKSKFSKFLKAYMEKASTSNKIYLINCDTYEENVLREASETFGDYEIINYHRNGHLKPKKKSIVKNVNITDEVSLPLDIEFERSNDTDSLKSQVFSPGKSDCSFELSDYDAKLEEMVNKTSRKEIMEIILGDIVDDSLTKMPKIDYITESNIDSAIDYNLKRKLDDETTENNNRKVLTPNKIRKISTSDLITSTTQDTEEAACNTRIANTRSKYLGRAKRVGLPRPKRPVSELPNSPSSDKSVENYEHNSQTAAKTPNGKVKTPRTIIQRYETSDLYKPKLHYLSRRNIT